MTNFHLTKDELPALSNRLEKVLEYHFLALISAELLRRRLDFDVLRGEVDAFGHDIVIEAGGIIRHIQLKTKSENAKARFVTVNVNLLAKPSGCLIWIDWMCEPFPGMTFRWLGGSPGEPFPLAEGAAIAKRTRPNGEGKKLERSNHRKIMRSSLKPVKLTELVDELFGPVEVSALNMRHFVAAIPSGDNHC
jgi:hypothetical protein